VDAVVIGDEAANGNTERLLAEVDGIVVAAWPKYDVLAVAT